MVSTLQVRLLQPVGEVHGQSVQIGNKDQQWQTTQCMDKGISKEMQDELDMSEVENESGYGKRVNLYLNEN